MSIVTNNKDLIFTLDEAINAGLCFLQEAQLLTGEFVAYLSKDCEFVDAISDSSPFITCWIHSCLRVVNAKTAAVINQNGINWILSQQDNKGLWRYWSKQHPLHETIPVDLDDLSTIGYELRLLGHDISSITAAIHSNISSSGLYFTWDQVQCLHKNHDQFWKKVEASPADIDIGVNLNIYRLLKSDELKNVIMLTFQNMDQSNASLDKWYCDSAMLYYLAARAGLQVPSLHFSSDQCNFFNAALICSATLKLSPKVDSQTVRFINLLLDSQNADGSWPARAAYYGGPSKSVKFGSSTLSTALALEALSIFQTVLIGTGRS